MQDAPNAGRARRGEHVLRARDVDGHEALPVTLEMRDEAGHVDHASNALAGGDQRVGLGDVTHAALDVETVEGVGRRALQHAHPITASDQVGKQDAPEEAAGAGDENRVAHARHHQA